MNQKGIDNFNDGLQALLLSQPFFGALVMKMKHQPVDECPTLFTNGRVIGYGPDFMAQQNTKQAMFCIGHEVLHAAWMHLDRIRYYLDIGIGPDGQALDMHLFNMALDYPINASLVATGVGEVPAGIKICLDRAKYPETMTPEEVYCLLKQQQGGGRGKAQPGSGGQAGSGNGHQALDEHQPSAGDGASPEDRGITAADVQQAANVCKAVRGTLPAGIDRLLGEIEKPKANPWKRLRQGVLSSLSGYDATTWRRLQRRMIVRRIGMPGRTGTGAGRIGVVADTSGSIGDEMLRLFGGHMAAIMDEARPREVMIYWTDAQVHRVDKVTSSSQLRAVLSGSVPGGGGTDMPEGVRAAVEDKCDCIVVLTDGYTPFCNAPVPVFWAITSHIKSPHGTTVNIGEK